MRPWVLVLGWLGAGCGETHPAPDSSMPVVRIVRDFLSEAPEWETVRAHPDGVPRVEVVCPALSPDVDGADMPALLLAPPGEVRLELRESSTPARLVARVGVDQVTFGLLNEEFPSFRIAFELRSGTRVLAREEVDLVRGQHLENAWADLGGPEGIEIDGPQVLTLATEALMADGTPYEPPLPLRAGFGGLRLERRLERARTKSSPAEPNVVLVVMDTLRADRLSCYGYERPTSPRLDELAARGVLFEDAYSTSSWTWPSTASILTGLTPMEHGLIGEGSSFLIEPAETLAERMQLAGFTTAAWSANPIVSPLRNFDQGFERFRSAPGRFQKTDELFDEVRAFLREQADTRFFLYLHLADPHTPLRPLPEGRERLAAQVPEGFQEECDGFWHATGRGQALRPDGTLALDELISPQKRDWTGQLYDASVWSGDYWLGELLDELAALGLEDETVVAFTADHGEELFERGILGHGQSLRRELVSVPLVLAGPGIPRAERRIGPMSNRALAPMLSSLASVPFPGSETARSLLDGSKAPVEPVLFSTTKGFWKGRNRVRIVGIAMGDWKLDWARNGAPWGSQAYDAGDFELFNVRQDPGETKNLWPDPPSEAVFLRTMLEERLQQLEDKRIGRDIPAGGATLQMLQQLGYIGDD